MDYGAGNGLLGIFARYCGFGRVALNDIDLPFLEAARKLSQALHIDMDAFIEGDISQVKDHPYAKQLNAIAGTDVIEHIYNLDDFFGVDSFHQPIHGFCFYHSQQSAEFF
ncbi:MAG: hypothetical protein V9E88_02790 [Ferruginibacter sp.]